MHGSSTDYIVSHYTYVYIDAVFRLGVHFPLTVRHLKLKTHVINGNGVLPGKVLTRAYKRQTYRCYINTSNSRQLDKLNWLRQAFRETSGNLQTSVGPRHQNQVQVSPCFSQMAAKLLLLCLKVAVTHDGYDLNT